MRFFRVTAALAALPFVAGCGYVHFGRVPPAATGNGDAAYSALATEHKILKQELVLARKEGDALRAALDRGPGAAAPEMVARLNETSRELAALRVAYAKLQAERGGTAGPDPAAQLKLSELEEKLAASLRNYTRLQEENTRLRTDITTVRAENTTLAEQIKLSAAQYEQAQGALAQLNTELVAQKEARARAEQAAAAVRAQLSTVVASASRNEPAAPAAPATGSAATSSLSPLQLAKAPPADLSATAELRTNSERARAAASAAPEAANAAEPAPAPGRRVHTVVAGDTLEKIAQKYYGTPERWSRIYAANNTALRDGRPLRPGMQLEIPER